MTAKMVHRIDVFESELVDVKRTDEGFAHFFARATRTGVFPYRNADGSIRRELRLPEEVFHPDSMKTLQLKPITNDHPMYMVDSTNSREYTVGMTGEEVIQDGIFLKTKATITDQATIDDVIKKGKAEVSCGYYCKHDRTPGVYEGQSYDLIQRDIRYNHLAVVDSGRAGPEVKLRLDSGDAIMLSEIEQNMDNIQAIIVSKEIAATLDEARKIAENLNVNTDKSEETEDAYRFNQKDPSLFKENSLRSDKKKGSKGVKVLSGKLKYKKSDALSHSDMKDGLSGLLKAQYNSENIYVYVEDIIGNEVIYNVDSKDKSQSGMFKQEFQILDDKISLIGNINRVQEVTTYKVIDKKEKIKEDETMAKVKIDGIEQEVSDEFKKAFDSIESKVADSAKNMSELQAKVDSLTDKLSAKADEDKKIDSSKEINERVNARVALYHAAKDHCDEEVSKKLDSMSDLEIKKSIIKASVKDNAINLDEKDEAYVNARFDIVMEDHANKDNGNVIGSVILNSRQVTKKTDSVEDKRMGNWKNKSGLTKEDVMKVK